MNVNTQRFTPMTALIGRVFWMMLGPIMLALLALSIAGQRGDWLTTSNLAYFPVLGGTMLGRWLEFRGGRPMTSTGEPATPEHLRRYLYGAAILGLGVWLVVNLPAFSG